MPSIESALVVLVPEAENLVKTFREKHDPAASIGVPAHITLLYPFIRPNDIHSAVLNELTQCFVSFTPFRFSLTEMRRFPGVLYLAPEPDEPFRALTLAIWSRYPERPPYEGRHSDIVPHLCVAQLADEQQLDVIAEEFMRVSRNRVPIQASVEEIILMDNSAGDWRVRHAFPLEANGQ